MLLAGLLMALPGCGSDHPAAPVKQNTPTGSYSVNLNATSGGITRSSVLTLNVE
jgi:PKD repeat protein